MTKKIIRDIDRIPRYQDGLFRLSKEQIVYKAVIYSKGRWSPYEKVFKAIAKLRLPVGTLVRLGANGDAKCRANQAYVVEIKKAGRKEEIPSAFSTYDPQFVYRTGANLKPDRFDDGSKICSHGLHFFRTLAEAKMYLK